MVCSFLLESSCWPKIKSIADLSTIRYLINGLPDINNTTRGGFCKNFLFYQNSFDNLHPTLLNSSYNVSLISSHVIINQEMNWFM